MSLKVKVYISDAGYILCDYSPKVPRMTYGRAVDIRDTLREAPIFYRLKKANNARKALEAHGN